MPGKILKFFKPSGGGETDGLTQPEREAIADLLHYCMYADSHIAIAEAEAIGDVITTLDWDPNIAFEAYEARSIAEARRAREDESFRTDFLQSVRERLATDRSKKLALEACQQLVAVDGATSEKENEALGLIREVLKG